MHIQEENWTNIAGVDKVEKASVHDRQKDCRKGADWISSSSDET